MLKGRRDLLRHVSRTSLIDLSHMIEPGMPRFPGLAAPEIRPVWTHAQAASRGYRDTTCELTEVRMVTSVGTYLDAPYHFDPDGVDIGRLELDQLVVPGVVADVRETAHAGRPLPDDVVDGLDLTRRAVLFCTGWSAHWGVERYYDHPFISRTLAETIQAAHPALVGVDSLVVDDPHDPTRPAHTLLLGAGILIVENLAGLAQLVGRSFTFVAAPAKVAGAAAFPVRAFAIVD